MLVYKYIYFYIYKLEKIIYILEYINIYKPLFFKFIMVIQCKIKKIGTSKHLLVPFQLIRKYNLDKYIYLPEIEDDGRQIIFKRMKAIEEEQK